MFLEGANVVRWESDSAPPKVWARENIGGVIHVTQKIEVEGMSCGWGGLAPSRGASGRRKSMAPVTGLLGSVFTMFHRPHDASCRTPLLLCAKRRGQSCFLPIRKPDIEARCDDGSRHHHSPIGIGYSTNHHQQKTVPRL